MIREGTFDQILVRPLPSLFQLVAVGLRRAAGRQGCCRASPCSSTRSSALDVDWTVGRVLAIPFAIVAGALIYGAVWVALATIAFWIVDAIEFVNAFTYGGSFLSQYPIGIFARWLRGLVVFLIPVAFVAYFPALYVLDKEDELGLPAELQYLSPLVAVLATARRRGRLAERRAALPERRWLIRSSSSRTCEKRFVLRAKKGRLRRERRTVSAVDGISFSLERGTIVGYLGPNGAGKSTTVKMLTGILVPSAGTDPGRAASTPRGSGSSSRAGSASSSASARSSGGTCRSPTRSSCCATSTASRPSGIARASTASRRRSSSARSSRRPCASSRSASGCAAS